ncbi:B3 domain-containing protein REM17-like, partial [Brassica napus]|uniref:B3 domain-containing protein REM17-like n=1 Tax=Brassica napus TaxID=3708 RepID=UPI0020790B81
CLVQNIPVAFFSTHIKGRNDHIKIAKLRTDASDKTWKVKMDGSKFTDGWEDFAVAHDLRVGDITVFRHEGEMVFHVTALGPSFCEIQYTSSHNINDDTHDQTNNIGILFFKREEEKSEEESETTGEYKTLVYSFICIFICIVCLTLVYNVGVLQYLGREFVTSNGLNKGCSEIVLKNEGGGRWTLPLKHYKSINHTYLGPGWTTFCQVNGIKAEDAFMFKLVRTGEKPVLCLCPEESSHRDKTPVECLEDSDDVNPLSSSSKSKESKEESLGDKRASSSYSEDRFLTLTLTQKAVKRYQLVKIINKSALRLSVILVIFSAKIKSLCSFFRWVSRRGMTIPVAFFLKHVQGRNDHIKIAKLTTDASDKTWTVKMDALKLTHGWEDFALAHDLRVGDMIVFRHEGELVFHVTTMGPSCCEIQYTHNINHNHTNNIIESSSSDNSLFVAKVSASNLRLDRLYLPMSFARTNGLDKMSGEEIILLNGEGRSWSFKLKHDKSDMHTFIRPGWRRFCAENGMSHGHYTLKLVRNSGPPVIKLCGQVHNRPKPVPVVSSLHHSCFVGSVTSNSLKTDKLYLGKKFVIENGLDRGCSEMVLKNEWGGRWSLALRFYESAYQTYLGPGWRTFCQVNEIKVGDSFKFKLVGTGDNPVLLLCTRKTPLECPEESSGSDTSSGDDSSEPQESEEESLGDKNISQ